MPFSPFPVANSLHGMFLCAPCSAQLRAAAAGQRLRASYSTVLLPLALQQTNSVRVRVALSRRRCLICPQIRRIRIVVHQMQLPPLRTNLVGSSRAPSDQIAAIDL